MRAVEALIEKLSDEDASVREEATAALEKLGKKETHIAEEDESGKFNTGKAGKSPGLSPSISMFSSQKIDEQKGGTSSPNGTRIVYTLKTDAGEYYAIAGPEGRIN
jgi:HEAT repeat protein